MREIDINRAAQILEIKNRLNKAYGEHPMPYHKLLTELVHDSGYEINYSTLKNTLNTESYALDMCTVLAMCRYWHLDVSYILSPPSATGTAMPAAEQLVHNGKFTILDDQKYFGTFHGYMYTQNPQHDSIFKFELTIGERNKSAFAKFALHRKTQDVDGTFLDDTRIFTGTPILQSNGSNVFILLSNDVGEFYFMYFSRLKFSKLTLYFRRGVLLSSSTADTNPPVAQSFVLFANQPSEDKMQYIPGLLSSPAPSFYISKDEVDTLRRDKELVDRLFEDFGYIFEHNKLESVYKINQKQILPSITGNTLNSEDVFKSLYLLRERSLSEPRIYYDDDNDVAGFCKTFMQQ